MFVTTKRDGVGFNLAYIDSDFTVPYKGPFDQGYMRSLFEYGHAKGKAGYRWHKTPPATESDRRSTPKAALFKSGGRIASRARAHGLSP